MKKRALLVLTLAAILSAGSFAACKDKNQSSSSESQSSSEEKRYAVSFVCNGGSEVEQKSVIAGEEIDLGEIRTEKENFYFYGWCLNETLTHRAAEVIVPERDMTLYAEWGEIKFYTLSFQTADGSAIASRQYKPNDYLAAPADPVKEGYVFAGWYQDAQYAKQFNFAGNRMPAKDITVYAKWNETPVIRFDSAGGSEVKEIAGEAGDKISAPAAPVKEGFIFDGWYTDESYTSVYEFTAMPEKSVTVYAKWHEQKKDVALKLHINNPGFEGATVLSVTQDEGTILQDDSVLAAFQKEIAETLASEVLDSSIDISKSPVYTFNGWAYDAAGTKRFEGAVPHENADLYATWVRSSKYCKVTFLAEDALETPIVYYVVKNTAFPDSVLKEVEDRLKPLYEALGYAVNGFSTSGQASFSSVQPVAIDTVLLPNLTLLAESGGRN